MVFHYINFVQETNNWWLRRVRPVWMGSAFLLLYWSFYRYYFTGKIQSNWAKSQSEELQEELAKYNKRSHGYGKFYQPVLEISTKKRMYEELGDDYVRACSWAKRFQVDDRRLEQLYREENEEFSL